MFKKAIVAISIFALLFIGAWVLNEQTKREYYMHNEESDYQIQQTDDQYMIDGRGEIRIFPAFMSREYIRVVDR
ncbi:hypothetical protein [Litchfieldia salsa]|uniref:Uncharacterized protein n=1 Tax=Litchfieldia salsa TaxID=930152 RepID=A0A1H0WYI0_9BACI|nr:hypothetical protein [Litchfieldia salsa]SDP95680.1 hypothetical protein SAMN05216565_11918 [Litchfieldia salsa]